MEEINEREIKTYELSKKPLVVWFVKVIKDNFCDEIIKYAKHNGFNKSKVVDSDNEVYDDVRTGSHSFDYDRQLDLLFPLFSKITGYPEENFEGVQLLEYKEGEEYGDHFDFFNTNDDSTTNDRVATLMLYLNDDFSGGNTNFPELGIKIKPNKGGVLFFDYSYDKATNLKTLHSGMPVEEGIKYILVTWVRKEKYEEEKDNNIQYISDEESDKL